MTDGLEQALLTFLRLQGDHAHALMPSGGPNPISCDAAFFGKRACNCGLRDLLAGNVVDIAAVFDAAKKAKAKA